MTSHSTSFVYAQAVALVIMMLNFSGSWITETAETIMKNDLKNNKIYI